MNLIKLHTINNNLPIAININECYVIDSRNENNNRFSRIYLDQDKYYDVYEVPEKIINYDSKNLIKLHNENDNTIIIVNINKIKSIQTINSNKKTFSRINQDVFEFDVNETTEKILSMIEKI